MIRIIILAISLMLISSFSQACCRIEKRIEPTYPENVPGWIYREDRGVHIHGEFVLKKGESTENEKIRIRILELIPPDPCAEVGTFQSGARAKIQFIKVSDQSVLCEDTYIVKGSSGFYSCGDNLKESGVEVIVINAINLKEEWVHFTLAG
jgi:hypothetical protein